MASIHAEPTEQAERALNRAIYLHLLDPNVSHIDLGYRILDREDASIADEFCVRVHLRRKLRGEDFRAFAARHPRRVIDASRIGFPVDRPQADYKIQPWPWWAWYYQEPASPRSRIFNPMKGGISISNSLKIGFGTLGGRVRDRQTGEEMILSNWHVLSGSWYSRPGLPIYQPGRGDGGDPRHTVAYLERDAMDQFLDAAVAKLSGSRPLVNEQLDIGLVKGVTTPLLGMSVTKSGRRSQVTSGVITGIEGRRAYYYGGVQRVIRHIIHIAQSPAGGKLSSAGDSGSWWLEEETHQATGLHFAGSDFPEYALAIAMPPVLEALHVDIVDQAGAVERMRAAAREAVRVGA